MSELTEGINALATMRRDEKQKVYIVFRVTLDDYIFQKVFFTKEAAELYISKLPDYRTYEIEVYEEAEDGNSKLVNNI